MGRSSINRCCQYAKSMIVHQSYIHISLFIKGHILFHEKYRNIIICLSTMSNAAKTKQPATKPVEKAPVAQQQQGGSQENPMKNIKI